MAACLCRKTWGVSEQVQLCPHRVSSPQVSPINTHTLSLSDRPLFPRDQPNCYILYKSLFDPTSFVCWIYKPQYWDQNTSVTCVEFISCSASVNYCTWEDFLLLPQNPNKHSCNLKIKKIEALSSFVSCCQVSRWFQSTAASPWRLQEKLTAPLVSDPNPRL